MHEESIANFETIADKCLIMSRLLQIDKPTPNTMSFILRRCDELLSIEAQKFGGFRLGCNVEEGTRQRRKQ